MPAALPKLFLMIVLVLLAALPTSLRASTDEPTTETLRYTKSELQRVVSEGTPDEKRTLLIEALKAMDLARPAMVAHIERMSNREVEFLLAQTVAMLPQAHRSMIAPNETAAQALVRERLERIGVDESIADAQTGELSDADLRVLQANPRMLKMAGAPNEYVADPDAEVKGGEVAVLVLLLILVVGISIIIVAISLGGV